MEQKRKVSGFSVTELTETEMINNSGGGLIDVIVRYMEKGMSYCYSMGLSEALHYKKQLQ